MNLQEIGKYVLIGGGVIAVIGLILMLVGNKLCWLGHLPGDIHINKPGLKIYFPITTMILISLVINLIIWIIKKF